MEKESESEITMCDRMQMYNISSVVDSWCTCQQTPGLYMKKVDCGHLRT
jgi:hypothetical protein